MSPPRKNTKQSIIPAERIEQAILLVRSQKVMLDADLALLYGVGTRVLVQAVKRNLDRFPSDFMFQLTAAEFRDLRSHSVISRRWGGRRYPPYAFSEQGVAMLSSVLRSPRAVRVNIQIVRTFVRLRQVLASHADLERRLAELERRSEFRFEAVFKAIRELMMPPTKKPKRIGFRAEQK